MANIVYIAMSLDGFIARENGDLDWLMEIPNPENSDHGFAAFMDRIDGIVMGRITFETVVGFGEWPYTKPVFVLSNTLKELPGGFEGNAEILNGVPMNIVDNLNKRGLKTLYIDGGKTIRSFMELDLIDEFIITRVPIILGSGVPLFGSLDIELKLDLIGTEILTKDLVKSTYIRKHSL
jgi:dihydrofolate reductase